MYESHIPPINQPIPIPTQPKEQDLDDFIFAQDGAPVSERLGHACFYRHGLPSRQLHLYTTALFRYNTG